MKRYTFKELTDKLPAGAIVEGNTAGLEFDNIKPIFEANEYSFTWVNPTRKDAHELVANTHARIIICDKHFQIEKYKDSKCFIKVDSPKLTFLRLVGIFFTQEPSWGIHPTACVDAGANIHPKVFIGPNCTIGKCTIGEGTVIQGNCFIYDSVTIGRHVTVSAGTVIGADGFGYARNEDNKLEKFPHIGGVIIEDDVEIGANTCIDRGTLGNTLIKRGVKIDNLVHIAHNVVIGEDTMVIANSMIGGSTVIGKNSWIAPSASLRDAIVIGENVIIGMGSVVTRNVPDGETWAGNPAKELSIFKKQLKKIDEL